MNKLGGYRIGSVPQDAKYKQKKDFDQLPPVVDLRKYLTSIEFQVGNSCVANAFAGAYEYLAKRHLGDAADVSRLFIYYNARAELGEEQHDEGSTMEAAINALKNHGACSEEIWPNDETAINDEPPQEAYDHGAKFTIEDAEYVDTNLDLWKSTLAEGYPIVFSMQTFNSFQDEPTRNRGKVSMPKRNEQQAEEHGWHAMLCVGYSDKDQMFIVRNSWGDDWGDKGYCYIPYKYLMNRELNGNDAWVVHSVSDLEFDKDVWIDDDGSYLAQEGAMVLTDFHIVTEDFDGFFEALNKLCTEYSASEEDYYFDMEEGDDAVYINSFEILTDNPDEFIEALEELCGEFAVDEDYYFAIEGEDEDEDDEDEEGDDEDDEDEE